MTTYSFQTCRFCKKSEHGAVADRMIKYGVRHYAHPKCYLLAGKHLGDLPLWQLEAFPYFVAKDCAVDHILEETIEFKRNQERARESV